MVLEGGQREPFGIDCLTSTQARRTEEEVKDNMVGPLENVTGVQDDGFRVGKRFELKKRLGKGSCAKVDLGIDKTTGREVAIKTIKKSKISSASCLRNFRREIQIMRLVSHPNIIQIFEVFENQEELILVMEYAAGGELYGYVERRKVLKEDEARRIFRQIASAVYYCHRHNICHRDLKLENILLDANFNAKLADFGFSAVFDYTQLLQTSCGSPMYASPEIMKGNPYLGPEVDCWSLGVLLYAMVYGGMPFGAKDFAGLKQQIIRGNYFEPNIPAEAAPLINIMLTPVPVMRADIRQICSHPWLNQLFEPECLSVAEQLVAEAPVKMDLLMALPHRRAGVTHTKIMTMTEEDQDPSTTPPPVIGGDGDKADSVEPKKIEDSNSTPIQSPESEGSPSGTRLVPPPKPVRMTKIGSPSSAVFDTQSNFEMSVSKTWVGGRLLAQQQTSFDNGPATTSGGGSMPALPTARVVQQPSSPSPAMCDTPVKPVRLYSSRSPLIAQVKDNRKPAQLQPKLVVVRPSTSAPANASRTPLLCYGICNIL